MPLPTDEQVVKTSHALVDALRHSAGGHPGYRPAHAKGLLLTGAFVPSQEAKSLSKAYHLNNETPIWVRFSSSTGLPQIPDTDPNANPKGIAIRFHLPEKNGRRQHADIVAHSTPHFPTRNGEDFLALLQAIGSMGEHGSESPNPVEKFLSAHPETLPFIQAPKPAPSSFAKENYFGLNAFKFINADGKETFVRYRITPDLGVEHLDAEQLKGKDANYLYEEVQQRVRNGPVHFKVLAQIGEEGDSTDDVTKQWPESRKLVELGTFKLDKVLDNQEHEQANVIFDPVPRPDVEEGIEPSDDPILNIRSGVYLISGKERRSHHV